MSKGVYILIELVCRNCSTVFKGRNRNDRPGSVRFCSPECHYEYCEKQRQRPCSFCGAVFIPKYKRKNRFQFCNGGCRKSWLSVSQKGVKKPQISRALKGVPFTKERKARHGLFIPRGDKHPCWKGGISFEPYCPKFNKEFKERVRAFFGYRCVECKRTQDENERKLSVHHVHYDKETCCKEGETIGDQKFVALCMSCHGKVDFNREFWEEHYTKIINDEYGGKCYLSKTSILSEVIEMVVI